MNKKKSKEILKIVILISSLLITIPVVIFIINFHKQNFSQDLSDWANFGGFIGGVLNTIISLLSLVILSYITYLLTKQSDLENKETNLLMRRLDAYNEYSKYLPRIRISMISVKRKTKALTKKLMYTDPNDPNYWNQNEQVINELNLFPEFYYYVVSFEEMYGHLFTYDFQNEDFKELIEHLNKAKEYYKSVMYKFETYEGVFEESPDFNRIFISLDKFTNSLIKELN